MADNKYSLKFQLSNGAELDAGVITCPQGETGPQGSQGEKGETGAQGPKGDTGATGPQGVSVTGVTLTLIS